MKWKIRRIFNTSFGWQRWEWRALRSDGLRIEVVEASLGEVIDYALSLNK